MSKNTVSKTVHSALVLNLIATFEPFQKKLDENFDNTMGTEPPSVNNNFFKFMVGSNIQNLHRMLFSDPNNKEANSYDTIGTQIYKADQALRETISRRYDGDFDLAAGDPQVARQVDYIERLTIQEECVRDLYDQWMIVYKHFFREDWKPQARTTTTPASNEKVKAGLDKVRQRLEAEAAKNTKAA